MKFNNILAIPFALFASFSSQAELLNLTFTDTNGDQVTADKNKNFINPVSGIKLTLSAGLDRKVAFIIKDSNGSVVDMGDSPVISVDDTLVVEGKTYYGYELFTTALADNEYTLITQLKNYSGTVIDSEVFIFEVDTVSPVITGSVTYRMSGYSTGDYTVFSKPNFQSIMTSGVSDNNGEVLNPYIIAKKNGASGKFLKAPAAMDASTYALSITGYPTAVLPEDGVYDIGFEIADKAGNRAQHTQIFTVDNVLPEISISDVFNPKLDIWEPYTSGMTVHANPAKFRVRRKKIDHVNINGTKLGWYTGFSYEEGEYIYNNFTVNKPVSYTYSVFITQAGKVWSARQYAVKYVLAPGVHEAPKFTGGENYSDLTGWVAGTTSRTNRVKTISQVKLKAETRDYVQRASISGGGSCDIPVGATECIATTNFSYNSGRGYSPKAIYLASVTDGAPDGKFRIHSSYLYTYWDFNGGEFFDTTITNNRLDITYTDGDRSNSWQRNMWLTSSMRIKAENNLTGYTSEHYASKFNQTTFQQYYGRFDLETLLEEGDYKITVIAKDSYGNETVKSVTNSTVIDKTPPRVTISNNGETNFSRAVGLDGIKVGLTDVLSSEIVSIKLDGGPLKSVIYMAWRSEGVADEYKLEYPRIFPSLVEGEEYSLTVRAKDSFGNENVKTTTFMYQPPNLEVLPRKEILSTDTQLLNRNDKPYASIYKENLRRKDGLLVNGPHTGFFTLRVDSDFSVTVSGEPVLPGQTVEINFDANYGKLDIPIYPNQKVEGTINYLFEILSVNVASDDRAQ